MIQLSKLTKEVVADNAECEEETEEDMELNDEDEEDNSNDDEDPTWTPEEIDREYQNLKNEDDRLMTTQGYQIILFFHFVILSGAQNYYKN